MIHYHVKFNLQKIENRTESLGDIRTFLSELQQKFEIYSFEIVEDNSNGASTFLAMIQFESDKQFNFPFEKVRAQGINQGLHGKAIENVINFKVEVFRSIE